MRDNKIYHLRQAILRACRDVHPAALTLEELADAPALGNLRPSLSAFMEEWNGLTSNGYLSVCPGSDGKYRAINAKGLAQINHEGDKDQYVFGGGTMFEPACK